MCFPKQTDSALTRPRQIPNRPRQTQTRSRQTHRDPDKPREADRQTGRQADRQTRRLADSRLLSWFKVLASAGPSNVRDAPPVMTRPVCQLRGNHKPRARRKCFWCGKLLGPGRFLERCWIARLRSCRKCVPAYRTVLQLARQAELPYEVTLQVIIFVAEW